MDVKLMLEILKADNEELAFWQMGLCQRGCPEANLAELDAVSKEIQRRAAAKAKAVTPAKLFSANELDPDLLFF
jgi:hypothetical protein